jgi:hypothetical protein
MFRNASRLVFRRGASKSPPQTSRVLFRGFSALPVDKGEQADGGATLEEVFNAIDTNKDGVLQKEEFFRAVEMLHYNDLLKIKEALARNELSYDAGKEDAEEAGSFGALLTRRIQVTAEVAISKIFPAGFGWQTASTFAENASMSAANLDFALATGFGDGFCVFAGHTLWCLGKKTLVDPTIDMTAQAQTGILLGSAAFCSGTAWQPTVNALQAAGWSFNSSLLATTGVCTLAFFTGLRLGRGAYGKVFDGVEEATYANIKADAALSVAVGGAAGCFVGTDISYLDANWLRPLVGIEETVSPSMSAILAGTSTALGFTAVQMGENLVYPPNKCWVD